MSKKAVTLILLISIFFSVIAMSIWGKIPETGGEVLVTEMIFYDTNNERVTTINDSELQEKKIVIEADKDNVISYTFSVELAPSNANNLKLEYEIEQGSATIEEVSRSSSYVAKEEEKGGRTVDHNNIYHYRITFETQKVTTIQFTSNFSGTKKINDYLMFVFEGSIYDDDIIL